MQALTYKKRGMEAMDTAIKWIKQQKQRGAFRGEVMGPLGLEMRVRLLEYAHLLEQVGCSFISSMYTVCAV